MRRVGLAHGSQLAADFSGSSEEHVLTRSHFSLPFRFALPLALTVTFSSFSHSTSPSSLVALSRYGTAYEFTHIV
jgi:hypothetical protein